MRKVVLAVSAFTMAVPVALPTAAQAHRIGYSHSHQRPAYYNGYQRGYNQRIYCRKRSGTTGLIAGGAAGALAGRAIDKHGSRTTGTILGAAVGALLGRHVERNVMSRRCR